MAGETVIESLQIDISAKVDNPSSAKNIDKLAVSLEKLEGVLNNQNFQTLNSISNAINKFSESSFNLKSTTSEINKLSNSLNKLNNVAVNNLPTQISSITASLEPLRSLDFGESIINIGKGISSLSNGIKKIQETNLTNVESNFKKIADALRPLTDEMLRGETGAKAYADALYQINEANKSVEKSTKTSKGQITSLLKNLLGVGSAIMLFRKASKFLAESFKTASAFTENLALMRESFKENAVSAYEIANSIDDSFRIGKNTLLKYIGLFNQMSSAIGLVGDTAYQVSEVLTKLGLDIASLYNVQINTVMEDLRSMQAGQTKPIRKYGFDTTMQSMDLLLQQQLGIEKSSKALGQQEKYLLRIILILQQSVNAWGMMSREINNSATQMQILRGTIDNLKLAIGDAIEQPLRDALIFLNAIVIGITDVVRAFVPLKSAENGVETLGNSLGIVDEEIENIEKNLGLLSFDKFEVLSSSTAKVDASELDAITALFQSEYSKYLEKWNEELAKMNNEAVKLSKTIKDGILGFLTDMGLVENIVDDTGNEVLRFTDTFSTLIKSVGLLLSYKVSGWFGLIATAIGLAAYESEELRTALAETGKVLLNAIKNILPQIIELISIVSPILLDIALQLFPVILEAVDTLIPVMMELAQAILPVLLDVIKEITPIIKELLPPITKLIKGISPLILKLLPLALTLIDALSPLIEPIVKIIEALLPLIDALLPIIDILIDGIVLILDLVTPTIDFIAEILKYTALVIDFIGKFITALFEGGNAWEDFFKSGENVMRGFANFFASMINWVVNTMIEALNISIKVINGILTPINKIIEKISGEPSKIKIPEVTWRMNWQPFANGGIAPDSKASLWQTGEGGNPELVFENKAGQTEISNYDSILNAFRQALAEDRSTRDNSIDLKGKIAFDTTGNELARYLKPKLTLETQRGNY